VYLASQFSNENSAIYTNEKSNYLTNSTVSFMTVQLL